MFFENRDVISMNHFTKEEIQHVLHVASHLKECKQANVMCGKVMGSCFFEPSTRTRLSFEAAMHRMGGDVIGFHEEKSTSSTKGESLYDTMKVVGQYADVIVIRHPLEGAAQLAAQATETPVINAGDGTNQHPTQTFLDLLSIQETQGSLEGLRLALAGDLKHGRTVHSLVQACTHFQARLYFVAPPELDLPQEICHDLRKKGIKFSFHRSLDEVLEKVDILYLTRVQKERFMSPSGYQGVSSNFFVSAEMLKGRVKENMKILHPLPRVDELCRSVDETPYAHYFQQAENGLYVRQALLGLVLGKLQMGSKRSS